jgi:hypothetical protein
VLPARLEIFNQLVHGPEECVGALEDLLKTQLGPTARQLLGRLAASVRHDNPLHQRVQLEPRVSVAGDLADELHPLVNARRRESGKVRLRSTTSKSKARKANDVGFIRPGSWLG